MGWQKTQTTTDNTNNVMMVIRMMGMDVTQYAKWKLYRLHIVVMLCVIVERTVTAVRLIVGCVLIMLHRITHTATT